MNITYTGTRQERKRVGSALKLRNDSYHHADISMPFLYLLAPNFGTGPYFFKRAHTAVSDGYSRTSACEECS